MIRYAPRIEPKPASTMPLNQARHGAGTIAIDISAVASQPGSVLGVTEISRLALSEELPLKKTKADRPKKPVRPRRREEDKSTQETADLLGKLVNSD